MKEQAPDKVADIVKGKTTVRAVDTELRQAAAAGRAAEKREKSDKKEVKQHPKFVSEYLEASIQYRDALKLVIKCAKTTALAPEARQFIINRHEKIVELMRGLEKL
ncbi:MAG TPA: hypothetical protein ENH82_00890 [bacterium]|nr:hypothetical protein [bacterium]